MVKQILCLANSHKHGGTCFAGVELGGNGAGAWVRPVSSRPGHEVNLVEQTLPDGTEPSVLDVVSVGLIRAIPTGHQSENWLLDPRHRWTVTGRWHVSDLYGLVDDPATLWSNESSSSYGLHDRVPESQLAGYSRSIGLIHTSTAQVLVAVVSWNGEAKTEVRLRFTYRGVEYALKVTDKRYYKRYLALGPGEYPLRTGTLITVSLAEPWATPGAAAYSYKVVAAIIEPDAFPGGAG